MAQTWHTFPANCSDSARKSGSMKVPMKTTCHHPGFKVTSRELCLKSAKNLCLRHRFFDEIRQIHRFFDIFRQILQILCRNQARGGRAVGAPPVWRETPSTSSAFAQEKPGTHMKWIPGGKHVCAASAVATRGRRSQLVACYSLSPAVA